MRRGGAVDGPLGVQEPASTIERHTKRQRPGESQKVSIQAGEVRAGVEQPASVIGAQGPREPEACRTELQWTQIAHS